MDVQGMRAKHILLKEYTYTRGEIDRGYNNRTLYVNLSENSVSEKPVSEEMKEKFIGGKGFGLRLLWDGTQPNTQWNDPENEIVISPGPVAGITQYSGCGKSLVVAISPMTDLVIDCNVGGYFGPFLKFSGFDALEIQGKAERDVILVIDGTRGTVRIEEAPDIAPDSHILTEQLTEMYADDESDRRNVSVVSAGSAADFTRIGMLNFSWYDVKRKKVRIKQAGRGGIGTVFRDKRIKALVAKVPGVGPNLNNVVDLPAIQERGRRFAREMKELDHLQAHMKEVGTAHWSNPNAGATNESGFTLLPGGIRLTTGYFNNINTKAILLSSTEYVNDLQAIGWYVDYYLPNISVTYGSKETGYSIRCLIDSNQFGYLTISDKNFRSVSELNFFSGKISEEILLINSSAGETIHISSIYTKDSTFIVNKSSSTLSPGDSVHVIVTFDPREKGKECYDTLYIECDDQYRPILYLPLRGYLVDIDSIIDIRDGQVYNIVKIGQQWWMQENLNIGIMIDSLKDAKENDTIEKYCYHNNQNLCEVYGGLYQWEEMVDYKYSVSDNPSYIKGICPVGWRLPSENEFSEIIDYLGGFSVAGEKMKESGTTHWMSPNNATNESGFCALGSGYRSSILKSFYALKYVAKFWSTSGADGESPLSLMMTIDETLWDWDSKDAGFSVRCFRDSNQFAYLTIADELLNSVTSLNFYGYNTQKKLIITNSSPVNTINISSISIENSAFSLNKSSSTLSPGDSTYLIIEFIPSEKYIYLDTLIIKSDDPYKPVISIPLLGTFPPEILFTNSSNISCHGYSDGSATVSPSLGTPPYQYQWDDQGYSIDSTVSGLNADIWYHVIVTDSRGESITDSIILTEPDPLEINPIYSNTICLNSNDGFIYCYPSGGTPPYTYSWFNGDTVQFLTDLEASDEYFVTVTDRHGCQNEAQFDIHPITPFTNEKICIVTIDLHTGNNLIIWEKTPGEGIESYNVYREGKLIGTVGYNDLSIFHDTVADPEKRPYLYTISIVDTCGNESGQSGYHKPLFLQYVSSIDGVNLEWSKYEIEGEVVNFDNYTVYRGSDSVGLSPFEENIPTEIDVFTDNDPLALERKYYYRVAGVLTEPCYPSGSKKADDTPYSHSMSNIEDNRFMTRILEHLYQSDNISIYPNPFDESTTLMFNNPEGHPYSLYIMDITGKVCRVADNITTSEYVLEKGDLREGFYFVELRGPEIYRGKIVIE